MTRNFFPIVLALAAISCSPRSIDPVDYVDPFIGTGYHGHTYPGATTPFGMVQLSPDTRAGNWDACAGYHYDDTTIKGFSHTHLSGTGCADLADILFHPAMRPLAAGDDEYLVEPYSFSHKDERASCGYYSVKLPAEGIDVELTASPRTGVHRYTFNGDGPRYVVIDLMHTITEEVIDMRELRQAAGDRIEGMRRTQGWVTDHYVFFSARFSEPFADVRLLGDKQAVLTFAPEVRSLTVAVGLSPVSAENARQNSLTEVPELDFDAVHARAVDLWRAALGDIVVEGRSRDELTNFYTAQYHTKVTPNVMSDVNGQYRRHDQTIGQLPEGEAYYSTFSLWDTFRAWNPLQTLVDAELVNDMIRSMLEMYDATGELPIWPLASGETGTMIGYHAVSVIADAYLKGIRGYDAEKALTAMIRSSNINKKGSDYYVTQGFIPSNIKRESVSCALEYAYDDWAIARMAQAMGRDTVFEEYAQRALNYINVFDGSTRFFRGRQADGNWSEPFEEFATGRDYTEATPWQYRFFAPHDVNGMIQLFGSREAFVRELDRLFTLESDLMQLDVGDVTGLMGQYAHGNEPSHHMAYLYNYVGEPWKTQELTRRLLREMYAPTPAGIIGNEDCGQMSAWYIFSSLGFYPVCPGSNEFALTAPQFPKAVVRLANGRTLTVTANATPRNVYIRSVTLNGAPVDVNFITYEQLMQGGELKFELQAQPDYNRGTDAAAAPYSLTRGAVVSIPYTTQNVSLFSEPIAVDLATTTGGAEIRYTLDGSQPDESSALYTAPVVVDRSLTLRAKGFKAGAESSRTLTLDAEKAVFRRGLRAAAVASHPGVGYTYYEGAFSSVKDIRRGKYVSAGTMPEPSIADAPQEDHFGYIFAGWILIPERGVWEFMTKSDDGSVLSIGGCKVVDNDGSHPSVMATGRIALEAGLHPYTLMYFEDYEGEDLSWGWKAPGAAGFEAIPAENLCMLAGSVFPID
ncbi:GH92 family glycosyl hydrolase [uncultured Alistipes sp.]|jgi:putative alpha-1,2-mannosidase|uniref:GH92 family glycosyl hydrolase n=1 Tax=uncultured Alistipes sp. TaxID=538949 RepID=UPI0025F6199B|nr:GH92 family glycosyl hydrolase [uncultured Alistipes sp.]